MPKHYWAIPRVPLECVRGCNIAARTSTQLSISNSMIPVLIVLSLLCALVATDSEQ
jgi:hypothetical protein